MKQMIIAITGPSGIGKTTLGNLLIKRNGFIYPTHSTTRSKRNDDESGFYKYLSHYQFKEYATKNEFLFWSGDNIIIDSKYGNYYGILNQDYNKVSNYEKIIMYVSYKDIKNILKLNEQGYNFKILNLRYNDIEKNMYERLVSNNRNHTKKDIENRINCAIIYEEEFKQILSLPEIYKINSDEYDIEETYKAVTKKLIR